MLPLSGSVETEMIDLTAISISALRTCDEAELALSMRRVLVQTMRPRANIGGTGPPGRVD